MYILVPYRDREPHLAAFIAHMSKEYPEFKIVIGEQSEGKPFNRGKILNCLFLETKPDYFCAHDVDMLPIRPYPAPAINAITQIAKSDIQLYDYLGGVTVFPRRLFEYAGGYNNEYWHRAEDNEMMFNIRRLGIPVVDRFTPFEQLNHTRPAVEFDPVLWKKAQQPREVQDQLSICEYEITNTTRHDYYTKITVNL